MYKHALEEISNGNILKKEVDSWLLLSSEQVEVCNTEFSMGQNFHCVLSLVSKMPAASVIAFLREHSKDTYEFYSPVFKTSNLMSNDLFDVKYLNVT